MLLFTDFPHFITTIISLNFCSFLCQVWQTFSPVVFLLMSWGKKGHLQQTIFIFIKGTDAILVHPKITLGNLPYPINMWGPQPKTNFSTVVTHSGVIIPHGRRHTSPPGFLWQVGVKRNGGLTAGSCSCVGCEFTNPSFHEVW